MKSASDASVMADDVEFASASPKVGDGRFGFHADIERSRSAAAPSRGISPRSVRLVALLAADVLSLCLCVALGFGLASATRTLIEGEAVLIHPHSWPVVALLFAIPFAATLAYSWAWGHYTRFRPMWTELRELVKLALYIAAAAAFLLYALQETFSRLWLGWFLVLFCVVLPFGRHFARRWMIARDVWFKATWVVGTGDNARMTAAALESDPALGHRVDAFIDLSNDAGAPVRMAGKPVHRGFPTRRAPGSREAPCIVFALESMAELREHRAMLNQYVATSPVVTISPPISGLPLYGAQIVNVFRHDTVILRLQNNINSRSARFAKRCTDVLLSSLALLALLPAFLVIGWLASRDGHSPVYGHRRVGRNGVEFSCLKFRTMVPDAAERLAALLASDPTARAEWRDAQKLTNDPRITPVGRFLRATSLDELPQLVNVLRGEMSLVGPRPIVQDEIEKYGEFLPYYLSMIPGITGLWQSSGRSDTTYRERVLLDVWYARNWSLWHDMVIVLRTLPSLLNRVGAR